MKNIVLSFGGTGLLQLLNILGGVLAARFLLPEGRGELAAVLLWPTIVGSILYMSVDQAVAYYGASRSGQAGSYYSLAVCALVPLAALAMLTGFFLIPHLMRAYDPTIVALSQLYLLAVPLTYATMTALGALQGMQRFLAWNFVRVVPSAVYVCGIASLFLIDQTTVTGFVVASLTGLAAATLIGSLLVAWPNGECWRPRWEHGALFARYSLGSHLPVLAGIANRQLDKVMVALYLPPEVLGVYVVALSAADLVRLIGGAIGPIAFARVASQKNATAKAQLFGRFFRLTVASAGASALGLWLLGKWLIVLLFGDAFLPAADVLAFLLVGMLANTIKQSLQLGLKASARLRPVSISEYLGLVVQALALAVLLPRFGMIGAGLAVALSGVIGAMSAAISMSRLHGRSVLLLTIPTRDDFSYIGGKLSRALASTELRYR